MGKLSNDDHTVLDVYYWGYPDILFIKQEKGNAMLREQLAEVQHEIWACWMSYLFRISIQNEDGTYTIPADKVEQWKRQIQTLYSELSEQEKEGDREQADKVLSILNKTSL